MRRVQPAVRRRERLQVSGSPGGRRPRLRAGGRELWAQAARSSRVLAEVPTPRLRERRPRPGPVLPAGSPPREREPMARRQASAPRSIRRWAPTALAIDLAQEPAPQPSEARPTATLADVRALGFAGCPMRLLRGRRQSSTSTRTMYRNIG